MTGPTDQLPAIRQALEILSHAHCEACDSTLSLNCGPHEAAALLAHDGWQIRFGRLHCPNCSGQMAATRAADKKLVAEIARQWRPEPARRFGRMRAALRRALA